MARLTVSDDLGHLEGVIFPRQFRLITEQQGRIIKPYQIVQLSGKLEARMGKIEIIVNSVEILKD